MNNANEVIELSTTKGRVISLYYKDIDYGDDEEIMVFVPSDIDSSGFVKDYLDVATDYMNGYEYRDALDNGTLSYDYPDMSEEKARFFADKRECGLSPDLIMDAVWELYPKYKSVDILSPCYTVEFNEYSSSEVI